jgi:hypothetical protein
MKAVLLNLQCIPILLLGQETGKWGDHENGRFHNPIIAGDYTFISFM